MTDPELLEERLDALERTVVDGNFDSDDIAASGADTAEIKSLETRLDELEERVAAVEASTASIEGYVSNVEAVNEDVEKQANTAIAAVDRLEDRIDDIDLSDIEARAPPQRETRAPPDDTADESGEPFETVATDQWSGEEPTRDTESKADQFWRDEPETAENEPEQTADSGSMPVPEREETASTANQTSDDSESSSLSDTISEMIPDSDTDGETGSGASYEQTPTDRAPETGGDQDPADRAPEMGSGRADNGAAPADHAGAPNEHQESVDRILSGIDVDGASPVRGDQSSVAGNSYEQSVEEVVDPEDDDDSDSGSII